MKMVNVEGCKPAPTPASKATGKTDRHSLDELSDEAKHLQRSSNGTLTYYSADHWELQYAVLQISQDANCGKVLTWLRIKRAVRFIAGTADVALVCFWQPKPVGAKVPVDGDWAGEAET